MHQLPLSLSRFPFTLASFLAATAVIPSVRPPACLPACLLPFFCHDSLARSPARTHTLTQTDHTLTRSLHPLARQSAPGCQPHRVARGTPPLLFPCCWETKKSLLLLLLLFSCWSFVSVQPSCPYRVCKNKKWQCLKRKKKCQNVKSSGKGDESSMEPITAEDYCATKTATTASFLMSHQPPKGHRWKR